MLSLLISSASASSSFADQVRKQLMQVIITLGAPVCACASLSVRARGALVLLLQFLCSQVSGVVGCVERIADDLCD